ncbi:MAG: SDR family oxidoreductase, partial [Pseudomonadota bacterium]
MPDRVALVTGAARGIGLATSRLFTEQGWRVAMLDRDEKALAEAVGKVEGAVHILADVAQASDVSRAVDETLGHLSRIDALVNNAGVADFGPIGETDYNRWRTVMETNLDGPFLMAQAASG